MISYKDICKLLGKYLAFFSLALSIPTLIALYCQFLAPAESHPQPHSSGAFFSAMLAAFSISLLLLFLGRKSAGQIGRRESILLVALIWLFTALISALPFYFSRTLERPIDAYFEAMSGLTTTGATLISPKSYHQETKEEIPVYMTNPHVPTKTYAYYGTVPPVRDPISGLVQYSGIEAVGKAILFWRSFLQWIGGMGIVVIFLTILPALGVGGKFLYQMEMTGPFKEEITPRIHQTASLLWKLYLFLTLFEIALLMGVAGDLPFFDAICIALSNISTGGFSIRLESIASYHSLAVEWIAMLFMILGSINFAFYFHIIRMRIYRIYVPDFFLFFAIALGASALVSCLLIGQPFSTLDGTSGIYSTAHAIRDGVFQALSIQTSTGFITTNYDRWPYAAQMILLLLMFVGGMAGSTSGGIKTSRFYILYKIVLNRLESLYRPDSVRKLTIGSIVVDDKQALTVLGFFCIAGLFTVVGTAAFVFDGIDPSTALGLMSCFMNNVGAAFHGAGPTASFGFLTDLDKILASCWMLFGRLEFYVLLLLFLPAYWKGN